MKKTNRQNGWSFVIVLIAIGMTMGTYSFVNAKSDTTEKYIDVKIEEGDTLWELSTKFKENHTFTTDAFVKWVESTNGVKAEKLQPGDTVVIPVEAEKNQLASK
ncbi:LysM peptidoglycan-binding domain-containing protein [Alkalihalobacillus sp. TS-13]|uniref:cell division suppressor protein YneA n=1 Tax=Alkalihalobacillus sp. TS-13 TaxID=2842455 RepID=UPI001C86E26B|nr:LysM peptidoglycan-binding domain-containing protein [Alkalihalobacillus sp. TS-13]